LIGENSVDGRGNPIARPSWHPSNQRQSAADIAALRFGLGPRLIIGSKRELPMKQYTQQNEIEPQPLAPETAAEDTGGVGNTDEVIALLKSGDPRYRGLIAAAGALVVGFGLGWGCALTLSGPSMFASTEALPRRAVETSPGARTDAKNDAARKIAAVTGQRAPAYATAGSLASGQATSAAIRPALSNPAAPAPTQVNMTMAAREPMVAAPETKPTTIDGWTVLDVRGGSVVLSGPDGVRTASTGDTVPGVGRIESVVRWGNRWIVATASGLIATP
jgi:hypothetical protein